MTRPCSARLGSGAVVILLCLGAAFFSACRWAPKNSSIIKVKATAQYDSARLMSLDNPSTGPIRLYFIDDNTFQSRGIIEPGRYVINLRARDGRMRSAEVVFAAGERIVEVSDAPMDQPVTATGPILRGRVIYANGSPPAEASVVAAGRTLVARVERLDRQGRFEVRLPRDGSYRILIADLNDPPRSYDGSTRSITASLDLGDCILR